MSTQHDVRMEEIRPMTAPRCSQCDHEMIFDGVNDQHPLGPYANFHCSNCEQQAHVAPNGHGGMTLVNLFPTPKTADEHWAIADYQAGEKRMYGRMRVVAGYLTEEEYGEWDQKMEQAVVDYKAEHPKPVPFWTRLRRALA